MTGVINGLLAPLSVRQRKRVVARVIDSLMRDDLATVETARGTLRFLQLRSAYTASAVERFHQDEPETLQWIDGFQPGEVLWDIGANLGLYSLYAALDPRIQVYAFEPSGFNFGPLVEHIALNGAGDRVRPLCLAFGNTTGIGELFMSQTSPGHAGNSLNSAENQFRSFAPAFRQSVLAFSIDRFRALYRLAPPDHIKLDVDGIEDEIIAGAVETLPQVKSILIEVEGRSEGKRADAMERILATAGLEEVPQFRQAGSGRNRVYRR